MANILYISCHSILEYDEVKLFRELGHKVFSPGNSSNPDVHPNFPRPGVGELDYPDVVIDWADIIIFMHMPELLTRNWENMKHKRVIFRSIGQMTPHQEKVLQPLMAEGLEIVRYSPRESTIKDYAGETAMIRFYKDPEEYGGWTGEKPTVINFTQSLKQRAEYCGYDTIMAATEGFDRKIYGPENDALGDLWGGYVSYEEQKRILRESRCYIYTGTYPASYTLSFIEAMMTGIPIVAVGPQLGDGPMFPDQETYEVMDFIPTYDSIEGLRMTVGSFLGDDVLGQMPRISAAQREAAIKLFGKEKIKQEWNVFLSR